MLAAMGGWVYVESTLRRVLRGAALTISLALLSSLGTATAASAAETVIGFDHFPGEVATVPVGTIVTNQWKSEGLELGTAKEFGQPAVAGSECGSPSVEKETASVHAASAPNYAVLPACPLAGPPSKGTYGALLDHPRGALSVDVRSLSNGFTAKVKVTTFDPSGAEVAHVEQVNVPEGSWTPIAVPNPGNVQLGYFVIYAETPNDNMVGIDNLSFEKVEETKKEKEEKEKEKGGGEEKKSGGGGSTTLPPPTAAGTVVTPNPHGGSPVTLSGAARVRAAGTSSPTNGTSTTTARSTRAPARTRSPT